MRRFVSVGLLVALAGLMALPGSGSATGAGGSTGTTLDQTIIPEGDRDLGVGPGQARVTRTLDWNASGTGRALAGFKQVSDIHVLDEESPRALRVLRPLHRRRTGACRLRIGPRRP